MPSPQSHTAAKKLRNGTVTQGQVVFSIIIPTHDRSARLVSCLRCLAYLDYPPERFEVIVVDDGSPALLDEVVAPFRNALTVRLIRQSNRGPAAARNIGSKVAAGQYLVFTDDDCLPDRGWLRHLERLFTQVPRCLVGGAIGNGLPDNPFSAASQAIMTAAYSYYDGRPDHRRLFSTCNLAVPSACFHQLGGFCESFPLAAGEDYDFCDRWQHSGRPVHYAPSATVSHAHALTFVSFCRQHFNYGRGLLRFHIRSARRRGIRIRSNTPGFYLHLLTHALRHWPNGRVWQCAGLIVLSQFLTLAGACRELLSPRIVTAFMTNTQAPLGR